MFREGFRNFGQLFPSSRTLTGLPSSIHQPLRPSPTPSAAPVAPRGGGAEGVCARGGRPASASRQVTAPVWRRLPSAAVRGSPAALSRPGSTTRPPAPHAVRSHMAAWDAHGWQAVIRGSGPDFPSRYFSRQWKSELMVMALW